MQINEEYNIIERTTKYSARMITDQLEKGDKYKEIKPVIIISILNYNFLPYKEYINESMVVLKEHKEYELNKYQKYYYIELPKFRKEKIKEDDKVGEWLTFIDDENKEEVEKVMSKNVLVKKAHEEYEYLVGDERVRRLAELKERWEYERLSYNRWKEENTKNIIEQQESIKEQQENIKEQQESIKEQQKSIKEQQESIKDQQKSIKKKEKNIEEREKNIKEHEKNIEYTAKKELAHKMLRENIDISTIIKVTNLTKEEIESIKN